MEGLVELFGYRTDIPNLFSQSNIVALPSFYGEGLPKVLVEAAACGRAVITTRNIMPDIEFDFFKSIQNAFYAENKNTNDTETYVNIAKSYGIDENKFRQIFNSEQDKQQTINSSLENLSAGPTFL